MGQHLLADPVDRDAEDVILSHPEPNTARRGLFGRYPAEIEDRHPLQAV